MSDRNLSDDMVKLVRFTIVYLERDDERTLLQDEILVTDSMTADGFAAWQIAAYFQRDDHEDFRHQDKKYLRVCFRVLCRWPRESLQYQTRQLDELRGIRDAIEGRHRRGASPATPPTPEPSPLGEDEKAVLEALEALGGSGSTSELVSESGLTKYRVDEARKTLIEAGRTRREGTGVNTRYVLEE